jgi:hypothetical protein
MLTVRIVRVRSICMRVSGASPARLLRSVSARAWQGLGRFASGEQRNEGRVRPAHRSTPAARTCMLAVGRRYGGDIDGDGRWRPDVDVDCPGRDRGVVSTVVSPSIRHFCMCRRAVPGPRVDLRRDTFLGCVPVHQYVPRLGARPLVLCSGAAEAGRVGGRGNRPGGRGDANHASGLDEALPGLWTTEDRRVPPVGS